MKHLITLLLLLGACAPRPLRSTLPVTVVEVAPPSSEDTPKQSPDEPLPDPDDRR